MELGETVEQAAMREAMEEACAKIEIEQLLAAYSVPRIGQVQIMFTARLASDIAVGPESEEVRLFDWADIPWSALAFPNGCLGAHAFCQNPPCRTFSAIYQSARNRGAYELRAFTDGFGFILDEMLQRVRCVKGTKYEYDDHIAELPIGPGVLAEISIKDLVPNMIAIAQNTKNNPHLIASVRQAKSGS